MRIVVWAVATVIVVCYAIHLLWPLLLLALLVRLLVLRYSSPRGRHRYTR